MKCRIVHDRETWIPSWSCVTHEVSWHVLPPAQPSVECPAAQARRQALEEAAQLLEARAKSDFEYASRLGEHDRRNPFIVAFAVEVMAKKVRALIRSDE